LNFDLDLSKVNSEIWRTQTLKRLCQISLRPNLFSRHDNERTESTNQLARSTTEYSLGGRNNVNSAAWREIPRRSSPFGSGKRGTIKIAGVENAGVENAAPSSGAYSGFEIRWCEAKESRGRN